MLSFQEFMLLERKLDSERTKAARETAKNIVRHFQKSLKVAITKMKKIIAIYDYDKMYNPNGGIGSWREDELVRRKLFSELRSIMDQETGIHLSSLSDTGRYATGNLFNMLVVPDSMKSNHKRRKSNGYFTLAFESGSGRIGGSYYDSFTQSSKQFGYENSLITITINMNRALLEVGDKRDLAYGWEHPYSFALSLAGGLGSDPILSTFVHEYGGHYLQTLLGSGEKTIQAIDKVTSKGTKAIYAAIRNNEPAPDEYFITPEEIDARVFEFAHSIWNAVEADVQSTFLYSAKSVKPKGDMAGVYGRKLAKDERESLIGLFRRDMDQRFDVLTNPQSIEFMIRLADKENGEAFTRLKRHDMKRWKKLMGRLTTVRYDVGEFIKDMAEVLMTQIETKSRIAMPNRTTKVWKMRNRYEQMQDSKFGSRGGQRGVG